MNVPPVTDGLWRSLICGERKHTFHSVGAQMFLLRASMVMKRNSSEEPRLIAELHQLFVENADSPSMKRDLQALLP